MITIEYNNDTLHLTVTGDAEEVYDSLARFNSGPYAVDGVCYEDHKETIFGFFINNNLLFVIEGKQNDVSLQETMERSWGKPRTPLGTVRDNGNSDCERARGTYLSPPHRTG